VALCRFAAPLTLGLWNVTPSVYGIVQMARILPRKYFTALRAAAFVNLPGIDKSSVGLHRARLRCHSEKITASKSGAYVETDPTVRWQKNLGLFDPEIQF
jgi:hypothetical protein